MELIALLLSIVITFVCSYGFGFTDAKASTREATVIFCNQVPQDCKKEFEYYQLKAEIKQFPNLKK